MQRVFIRVIGFTSVERHALNTMFRLSQARDSGRSISYEPWVDGLPESAGLALVDGASGDANQELARMHTDASMGLIWVGAITPAQAWRSFTRPLRWPDVLTAIDMYFERTTSKDETWDIDFDLGSAVLPAQLDAAATQPAGLTGWGSKPAQPIQRALVVDADGPARMYLRSKLAAVHITHVDEASTLGQARDLLGQQQYRFVSLDAGLKDADLWQTIALAKGTANLAGQRPADDARSGLDGANRTVLLVTGQHISLTTQITAKLNHCTTLTKPLSPEKLQQLLQNL
jgi:CheY-like chemotaxis protein